MATREERIRERAHQLWEQEGCPEGRGAEHWERASREIDAAETNSASIGRPQQAHEVEASSQQTHPDTTARGRKAPRRSGGKAAGKARKP